MAGESFDVAVIGAGPAGSSAAIELAKAGARVALIDKSSFPREKCCGDGLTTGALRHLERLEFDPSTVGSFTVVDELAVRSVSGRTVSIPLGGGAGVSAAVATRFDLDAALVEHAKRAGAVALLGSGVTSLAEQGDAVTIGLEDGAAITADRVVAADGAWSNVRKLLATSAEERRSSRVSSNWTAFRAYAEDVSEHASRRLYVLFAEGILPGYIWSFPLGRNRANIGVFVRRDDKARGSGLRNAWEQARRDPYLVSLLGPNARLVAPARAWPIPASLDTGFAALDGRVLFAGDALGAADPFTGEGIAQALETGTAAARAIATTSSADGGALAYETNLRQSFVGDHRIAALLSRTFAAPLASRLAVVGIGIGSGVARQVGRFLYEDYARSEVLRPKNWRRLAAGSPPPYAASSLSHR